MKKSIFAVLLLAGIAFLGACTDYETYGEMKEKERDDISKFIKDSAINVISETVFEAQGKTTDLSRNEFVYLSKSGVYMQIVNKGDGTPLEDGKSVNLLCRFYEWDLLQDTLLICNDRPLLFYNTNMSSWVECSDYVDKMSVRRSGTSYTATFIEGMMLMRHSSSASVPAGWLIPLNYICVGRPQEEGDEVAVVRLIVPHSQGTADASSSVTPCYYEISYQRTK
jgi:hypothetical protein